MIPLCLSLLASLFQFALDVKHYLLTNRINQKVHVIKGQKTKEVDFHRLKVGEDVALYCGDIVHFVGKIKSGLIFVDESSINGTTALVKKGPGSSVVKGSVVVEGNAVCEVTELEKRSARRSHVQWTKTNNRVMLFNSIFSLLILAAISISFIYDKSNNADTLNNVSKASLVALPLLINVVFVVVNFVKGKNEVEKIKIIDKTFLNELSDIDVVCLDKTGTLTNGEYEVFKSVIISHTTFTAMSVDVERALEQTVSNIIRTTNETGGYFSALQEQFIYDVSKIIEDSSRLVDNGLYSAITIKGGKTYALGDPDNFDLLNSESSYNSINEYRALGYRVLLLVESKTPLNSGLIDGKSNGIAIIVLQEKIRENAKKLINYCLRHGKQVKIVSGDKIATVSEVARKSGLENSNRATSIKMMSFEKLDLLVEEDLVFADATPSQKAFIVHHLQQKGHKVLYIGDGDNDCAALKSADVAISMASGSGSANRCAHAIIDDDFDDFGELKIEANSQRGKMAHLLSMFYALNSFGTFYLLAFVIARFFDQNIVNPFEVQHLWLPMVFGLLIPLIIILAEPNKEKYRYKSFIRNFIGDSLVYIAPIGIIYIVQLIQHSSGQFLGIPSDLNDLHELLITSSVANNLSYLGVLVVSLIVVYNHLQPFDRYRGIGYIVTVTPCIIYAVLIAFSVDVLAVATQIDTSVLTGINFFAGGIIVVACASVYLLVLSIIQTVKGEVDDVKS